MNSQRSRIATQPVDQLDVQPGSNVTFSVTVRNAFAPQYTWMKDGERLSMIDDRDRFLGLDTRQLTIVNVKESEEGLYSVLVLAQFGPIISDGARLTVRK